MDMGDYVSDQTKGGFGRMSVIWGRSRRVLKLGNLKIIPGHNIRGMQVNRMMLALVLLMVITSLGVGIVRAQENYIFAGLSGSGGPVFVVNGAKINEAKLLDELVSLFKKTKNQEKATEFWMVVSTDLKISDYFALKGLLDKAGSFNEKSYFYYPSTKKMVGINIESPAKYVEWLDRDLKKIK